MMEQGTGKVCTGRSGCERREGEVVRKRKEGVKEGGKHEWLGVRFPRGRSETCEVET